MSGDGKVERDILGTIGVLGDLFGKDNPGIQEATARFREKVKIPSPDAPREAYGAHPRRGEKVTAAKGTVDDGCIDLTRCERCGAFFVTECSCGGKQSAPEPPSLDYAVYDKRGSFRCIETSADAACRVALEAEGFVRPRVKGRRT